MAKPGTALTSGPTSDPAATNARISQRLRIGIADRDTGFVRTLINRLPTLSMEPVLVSTASADALVPIRLDALILDVAIMGDDIWPAIEALAKRLSAMGLIVCTSPSSVAQRVRALRLGVDAWVTKPCHPEEVACVVSAVLRRSRRELLPLQESLNAGELTIRPDLYQSFVGARSLALTPREFQLLLLLAQNDRVLERGEIYERVWGYAMAHGDRSVDVFVRKLRSKLHAASPGWSYIHTHFGIGYRFAPERALPRDEAEPPDACAGERRRFAPSPELVGAPASRRAGLT